MTEENIYSAPQSSLPLPENKRGALIILARILTVPYFILWAAAVLRQFTRAISAEISSVPNFIGSLTGTIILSVVTLYPLFVFWRVSGKIKRPGRIGALRMNAGAGILVFALFAAMALFVPTNNPMVFWLSAVLLSLPYAVNFVAVLKLN